MKVKVENNGHRIVVNEISNKDQLSCLLEEINVTCHFLDIWLNILEV